ncbi:brain-enriched guanylate kinase-associated protein [Lemur catta]|uniref:brain-enriched guanylate kinase-associated protein n=1 Tax=Lemur catta TaxID=9447 RepID=UPI001E26C8D1|nr:brain-enriched guanylate kinase-associated protein [Lemur catta]
MEEQKGELRKRLSYTTHRLEKLENEFDNTRHFLEVELRRAQEELEKVTEKLRRIQNNYMALQRINQELEDKLYRMGQHYEEEKRALSHEIVALNSHLLEAKMTIQKLTEDNELYRKDCNLAAQLLLCSQTYGRVFKVSELPLDFQERVSLHMEKHGCSLPSSLCHPSYADTVPICVIAKVLEKPEPSSLSSQLSDASAGDLAFCEEIEKPGPQPPYQGDIYCSDPALYCPEEPQRDRRPSVDASVSEVGFLQAQNSTDSTAEEEEAEAAAYPAGFQHEAFAGYEASLPTSSSYSSFSAASEEKEQAQASTLTVSQPAVYMSSRQEFFRRNPPAVYESSTRFGSGSGAAAAPREAYESSTRFGSGSGAAAAPREVYESSTRFGSGSGAAAAPREVYESSTRFGSGSGAAAAPREAYESSTRFGSGSAAAAAPREAYQSSTRFGSGSSAATAAGPREVYESSTRFGSGSGAAAAAGPREAYESSTRFGSGSGAAAAAGPREAYESSTRFGSGAAAAAAPREAEVGSRFRRALPSYQDDNAFEFPTSMNTEGMLVTPNLWSLRAKPVNARLAAGDMRGHWRPPSMEDIGAYSYPTRSARRLLHCSFSERYGVGRGNAGMKAEGRASPYYASYKADSFSEGDDLSQGHLADACFLRACGELSLSPSRSDDPLPSYEPSEGDGDRLGVQLSEGGSSPEPDHGSRDSLEPSSLEASLEMHGAAGLSPQQAFPRGGGPGLSRKDSLTKAQLYGTLLN